jgi:hypothetical protein
MAPKTSWLYIDLRCKNDITLYWSLASKWPYFTLISGTKMTSLYIDLWHKKWHPFIMVSGTKMTSLSTHLMHIKNITWYWSLSSKQHNFILISDTNKHPLLTSFYNDLWCQNVIILNWSPYEKRLLQLIWTILKSIPGYMKYSCQMIIHGQDHCRAWSYNPWEVDTLTTRPCLLGHPYFRSKCEILMTKSFLNSYYLIAMAYFINRILILMKYLYRQH